MEALKGMQMDQLVHLSLWDEATGKSIVMFASETSCLSHMTRLERMV